MKNIGNKTGRIVGLAAFFFMIFSHISTAGTLTVSGETIFYDGKPIKLIGVRCSNALISDQTADALIEALDLYQSYGLNTVSVFVMGSRYGDVKGYLPDGSMNPVYLKRLEKILEATDSRGMVMIVGCLYWSTSRAKEDLIDWTQEDANKAIAGTAKWLGEMGFRHVILDPDNEGMAGRSMTWETEPMVLAAKAANPDILVANNTPKDASSADLNMHFGKQIKGKPWLNSETTPRNAPGGYWGRFSKETHKADESFYNYSRIGRYTKEMKNDQIQLTRELIEDFSGIVLASTWLQCVPDEGVGGPFVELGGMSELGSGDNPDAAWNRDIDTLHPDAGVRWWFKYIRDHYGPGQES